MSNPNSLLAKIVAVVDEHLSEKRARRVVSKSSRSSISARQRWLPSPGSIIFTLAMIGLLLWAQTAGAIPLPGYLNAPDAPSTGTIAYQGRLADANGNPLTSTVNMEFRLYSAATGGTPLWSELWTGSNAVQVSDGLFNVMLGSLMPIPQNIMTGNSSLWLGITAGTDDEMMPRVQLGSVPFAVQALTVPDGSVTTDKLAGGSVATAKVADGAITTGKLANVSVSTTKIADGAVTSSKLSRTMIRVAPSGTISMPAANTWYDVVQTTITLSRETVVTIHASLAPQNNSTETVFFSRILVNGNGISQGEKINKAGFGNTISMSTAVVLPAGQHNIKLDVSSWQPNGAVPADLRTFLVVVQG